MPEAPTNQTEIRHQMEASAMTDEEDVMLAVVHADERLVRILLLESQAREERPNALGRIQSKMVKPALEIVLNAHKRGGVTPGQLNQLEKLALERH